MKFTSSLLLAALASLAASAPIEKAPVKIDFTVERTSSAKKPTSAFVRKAALSVTLNLENEYSYYLAELSVGTPGQKMQVDVDTGSSDMWLPAAGSGYEGTPFDGSKSSTFKKVASGFQIGYGDGSTATGDWVTDDVAIGSTKLKDIQFGYATKTTVQQGGLLGVGYVTNEAAAAQGGKTYDNFPVELKKQGVINKNAYSLYLNSLEAKSGSILFGAIDKAKFTGELTMLDVVNIDDSGSETSEPTAFFVDLKGISASSGDFTTESYPALLDSGTTLIYAPSDVATSVAEKLGGKLDQQQGLYFIDCDAELPEVLFDFGSTSIKVGGKDLIFNTLGDASGLGSCVLGVVDSQADYYILGDAFLRSAYVYYDLEENKVGVAQVKYTDETDIQLV